MPEPHENALQAIYGKETNPQVDVRRSMFCSTCGVGHLDQPRPPITATSGTISATDKPGQTNRASTEPSRCCHEAQWIVWPNVTKITRTRDSQAIQNGLAA
jgi:hypothetical protein